MKIAVVTGASSGMGREFALQLAEEKEAEELWVIARRADRLEELKNVIAKPVKVLALDLTDPENFETYRKKLEEEKPEVRFLANCSGFGKFGRWENIPLSEKLNMIDLNCKALVAVTELTLPYMTKGAQIIQLDSLSSFQPVPYITVYGATKSFVLSYSRAMNAELKERGIRMMAVCPGWVKTEFFNRAFVEGDGSVSYFNILYEPKAIVDTAMKDLHRGKKDVSIHGGPVRRQVWAVKHLPHTMVMKIWMDQQKKTAPRAEEIKKSMVK